MTRTTTSEVLRTIRAAGIPQKSLDTAISVRKNQGVLHTGIHWCRENPSGHHRNSGDLVAVPIAELSKHVTCHCVAGDLIGRWRYSLSWELLLVAVTWDTKTLVPAMSRLTERFETGKGRKPAVGLVGKLQKDTGEALRWIEETRAKSPGNQAKVYLDELEDELVKAFNRLRKAGKNGTHQQALLERVQKELVPSNWKGELPHVDETPMVVAIAPPGRAPNLKIREVVTAFTIAQSSEGQLLEVPRYVYEYILRSFTPGSYDRLQIQGAEHPGKDIVETLFGVWNPADDGALRDLHKAIEAAKLLKS